MTKEKLFENIKQLQTKGMDLTIADKQVIADSRLELRGLINVKKKEIGLQTISLTELKNSRMLELRTVTTEDKKVTVSKKGEAVEKLTIKKKYTEEEAKAIIAGELIELQKKLVMEEFVRDEMYKFDNYLEALRFLASDIIKQDDLYSKIAG